MEAKVFQVYIHFHIMFFDFAVVHWPLKQMTGCPS